MPLDRRLQIEWCLADVKRFLQNYTKKKKKKISAIEYIVEMRHSADNSLRNRAALLWHFSFYLPFFALFRPIKWNEFEIMLSICIQENGKKN